MTHALEVSSMTAIHATEQWLSTLTRAEKAQLLQWIVCDLGDVFPGIETTPGVAGGEPRIVRTRIPIWVLEQARRLGFGEADLLRAYPSLRAEDLTSAWAFWYRQAKPESKDLLIA